jgi:microcystin-dependent protein
MTTPNGTGVTNRGTNYADGSQITSGNLKEHVDNAVFNTNAVDGVTLGLNSSSPKALFVNNQGIDTAQIKDDAVTSDKLADATLTFIKTALYPVGYVLTTINNYADSAAVVTAFGGTTWVRFGAGRALVGYDASDTDFDTAEEERGVKEVTLTAAQSGLPSHSHTQLGGGYNGGEGIEAGNQRTVDLGQTGTTGGTNASSPHTNLQPSIVVYMWKRTA